MKNRVLVMTAVEAELEAVRRGLNGDARFDLALAGVGPAMAAARTAAALMRGREYGLVISAGIGGGFIGRADVGSVAVASEIVAADLGAETPGGGFLSLDELGFGSARAAVDTELSIRLVRALEEAGVTVCRGPIITVSTVTGSADTALQRALRVSEAAAEGMEGYGVAVAARELGLPVLEFRAISNAVGPRDRSAWRIREAMEALEKASSILPEVLTT
ncbi:futalosine hydrolase [Cohnella pontilimi]|uniref:Futalosine hydrolase n=1 Tax=Cohnella pontilimi TaxID=2564100 RepID=A0A4U0FAK6_9BACL|nr:futalosine hydrolase [Cohnella pontilimi]TJY41826.1 futalosine hydrolase [Cohnella pontilimi]